MDEIAQTYNEPHKTKYVDASKRFRLPYYDYYRPRSYEVKFPGIIDNGMTSFPYDYSCPLIFTAPNLMIRKAPDDAPKLTPNPLYSYKFDQAGGMDWDKFTKKDKVFKVRQVFHRKLS